MKRRIYAYFTQGIFLKTKEYQTLFHNFILIHRTRVPSIFSIKLCSFDIRTIIVDVACVMHVGLQTVFDAPGNKPVD